LPDDTKVEAGKINVYDIDEEILIRYKDGIFIALDNFNGEIIKETRFNKGFLEMSNVSVMETLMRMHIILGELKNNGYNFDAKDQIILSLINNIPILNELQAVKRELLNMQEMLDTEGKLTITEDRKFTINGAEINFPRRYNKLRERMNIYEIFRNDLLKSGIKFLKLE
jgi:hypothetical protein